MDGNIVKYGTFKTGLEASVERAKMATHRDWESLEAFKQQFYPDGLPGHIDVNDVWVQMQRSNQKKLSNHMLWKTVKEAWKALSKWGIGSHWSEAKNGNGLIPPFDTPTSILAMLVIGFTVVTNTGKKPL